MKENASTMAEVCQLKQHRSKVGVYFVKLAEAKAGMVNKVVTNHVYFLKKRNRIVLRVGFYQFSCKSRLRTLLLWYALFC